MTVMVIVINMTFLSFRTWTGYQMQGTCPKIVSGELSTLVLAIDYNVMITGPADHGFHVI